LRRWCRTGRLATGIIGLGMFSEYFSDAGSKTATQKYNLHRAALARGFELSFTRRPMSRTTKLKPESPTRGVVAGQIEAPSLDPLDKYATKSRFSSKPFFKNLLNSFKYKGKIYGYPKDWSSLGMEVNTDLLGNNPVPTTWAQLRSVASKINVPNGKPICLSADWARLMAFVYQAGGNGQFKSATSAPFRVAVNYYVNLIKDGLATTPDKLGSDWCGEAFGKGRAAIAFEGNWMFPTMKDYPNVKFRTAPMPKGKTRGNLAFTVSYSMAKDSTHKAAAWELLKYLTGPAGMKRWTSLGLALPARRDVKPVAGRLAFVRYPGFTHGWGNQVQFRHVWNDVANNELSAVIQGKESVNDMLQKIATAAR